MHAKIGRDRAVGGLWVSAEGRSSGERRGPGWGPRSALPSASPALSPAVPQAAESCVWSLHLPCLCPRASFLWNPAQMSPVLWIAPPVIGMTRLHVNILRTVVLHPSGLGKRAQHIVGAALGSVTTGSERRGPRSAGSRGSDVIGARAGPGGARRAASPLPHSQARPLTLRRPHWLRGRPMGRRGPRARALRPGRQLSRALRWLAEARTCGRVQLL